LVNSTDTVPYPLTDELLKWRTYEVLYIFKEAQRGENLERGRGANWQFLAKAAHDEYKDTLRQCRIMDKHQIDLYFTKARQIPPFGGEPFASPNNSVNIGWF
jgi:hypothetical protein